MAPTHMQRMLPRVVIVDDHPVISEGLRLMLESRDIAKVVALPSSAMSGYASYIEHRPNLIVVDLSLPEGSGLILTRRVRARDPDARVLIFSIHDSVIMRQRAFEAGANAYLAKSSSTTEICDTVQALLAMGPELSVRDSSQRQHFTTTPQDELGRLTPREFDIFLMLAEGRSVLDIANDLSVSPKTIGVHQTRIMKKLHAANSAHLAHLAIRQELILP